MPVELIDALNDPMWQAVGFLAGLAASAVTIIVGVLQIIRMLRRNDGGPALPARRSFRSSPVRKLQALWTLGRFAHRGFPIEGAP